MKTINYAKELESLCKDVLDQLDRFYTIRDFHKDAEEGDTDFSAKFLRTEAIPGDTENIHWVYFCNHCKKEEFHVVPKDQDFIYIGECPIDENPFPKLTSRITCMAFKQQLQNTYSIPKGGALRIKTELGGGGYYEVVADYNMEYPESYAWALFLEGNTPERWSPKAKAILKGDTNE